ncbi:MAG: xenobiotic ABC transporter ATP-binding protein [Bacteroidia bacterium]|nr:MAG: xenobiotic ABC transporter ATP-binding protein [Bacteroidia bacterium]
MSKVSGKAFDFNLLKKVLKYSKPYKRVFALTIASTILLAILSPLRPWLIQYTIDNYVAIPNSEQLLKMVLLMIGILIIESIVQFFNTYYTNWLGQTVIKDLRINLFRHILNFRLKYFDNTPIGTLVTRVISDIEAIADIFSEGLLVIMGDLLKIVAVIAVMLYADVKITIISLSVLPLLFAATSWFQKSIKKAFQDVRTQIAQLNAFVQEHITGISVVQLFNREDVEFEKFKAINAKHRDANIDSIWYYSIFFPVVELLLAASIGLLVWWGAGSVIKEEVSLGTLIAFILYVHMLFRPIRELADKFNTLQMGMVASERVFKILETSETIENIGKLSMNNVKGKIDFQNVWFAYNNEDWILKNVSFSIAEGKSIAIVGPTGAGKTSIINLFGRYYEYQKGNILVDDHDLREYEVTSLRKNIAFVLQDVFLFSDTIANNISLNDPTITRKQIIEAAKAVGAHNFIMNLPGNYDFNVMERGGMLSVGQRQLIAFIRAYVQNPKILVLDEATSSVDTETEQLIQLATNKLTENRTSIIIAHRLATIQKADKIIVLDHGEVIEQGSHQELLKQNGQYKRLFELQFNGNNN